MPTSKYDGFGFQPLCSVEVRVQINSAWDKAWANLRDATGHPLGSKKHDQMIKYCGLERYSEGFTKPEYFLGKLAELGGPYGKVLMQAWIAKHEDRRH